MPSTLSLFVFFAPFTTWLAISTWLRLPVALILAVALLHAPKLFAMVFNRPLCYFEDPEDVLLYIFMTIATISWALGFGGTRSLNHLMAFSFSCMFYLTLTKVVARESGWDSRKISGVVAYSAMTCCVIIVVEFLLLNLYDLKIRPLFTTGGPGTSNMDFFLRGIFKSVAGTAEEPGSMALFLNVICPIGLWHFEGEGQTKRFITLCTLYVLSLLFLTSIAGIVIAVSMAILASLFRLESAAWFLRTYAFPSIVICTGLAFLYREKLAFFLGDVTRDLVMKLAMSQSSGSASIRTETWTKALENWRDSPVFGQGPGYGIESLGSGYHSMFLTVLADLGAVNFLLLCLFLSIVGLRVLALPSRAAIYFILPFFGSIIHFNIVGDFYHAPFWISVAIVQMAYTEIHKKRHEGVNE